MLFFIHFYTPNRIINIRFYKACFLEIFRFVSPKLLVYVLPLPIPAGNKLVL